MNEIAKQRISERVIEALDKEILSKNKAGPMLGIPPSYLSCVVNPKKLNKCPDASWDILQKWVNSGLSIKKYVEKNGVLTRDEIKKEVITKEQTESNATLIGIVNDPKDQELKPQLTKGYMIDFLIKEKDSLKVKIDAIDVLLKHYIS